MSFIKNKRLRRPIGAALVVAGGLLMWLSPEVLLGAFMFATGVALEGIGIWLEHGQGQS